VARKTPSLRVALVAALSVLVLALVPVASAAPGGGGHGGGGGGGGGGKGSCTTKTPGISIDNNWQWGQPGSWGLPGQTLKYAINVTNYDVGCGSSTFTMSVSAPNGFSVSIPSSVTLRASSSSYLYANVTSPSVIADGDYPLTVTLSRTGTSNSTASSTSYYKVYSTDTTAPTLYWPNPADGMTVSGSSYQFMVSSSDDHAVNKIELYVDNVYTSTTFCDNIAYECQLAYSGSAGARGQHTATFKSYDWKGNVGILTSTYTVG
jgi:Bacterial Ig domain